MISKIYKITYLLFCLFFFYQNTSYSKNFDEKNVDNYFSALISLNENKSYESLKYFNLSKQLKEYHPSYIENYIYSLVLSENVKKAISEIKLTKNKSLIDFFDSHLLLLLDSIKKNEFNKSLDHIKNLKKHQDVGNFEYIVSIFLEEYVHIFNNNQFKSDFDGQFGKMSLINKTLQSCYLGLSNTEKFFENLINDNYDGYSRYLFFYANYLISKNNHIKAKNIFENIEPIKSTLLIAQVKKWIDMGNYDNLRNIFSCKNPSDIISEFIFIISTLYSSEEELNRSNFYFNLSYYLNPKFKFNLAMLADNYFQQKEFDDLKRIIKKFNLKNEIYYWYKIKKIAEIIKYEENEEQSFKYINSKFKEIEKPSLKIIYEMGNLSKNFQKYELAIEYYTEVLSKLDPTSEIYANVLYRRGSSYERLGNENKADEDLLKSLKIKPDEPHVLNYLAYSWLERNYNVDSAMEMLRRAYNQLPDDPYIIDSIGWAYYLIGNYIEAEKLLRKATELMPLDPIVNDHYGDILWKLGRKMQANYFWKNVLTFEDTKDEMKEEIYYKLINGPKKI